MIVESPILTALEAAQRLRFTDDFDGTDANAKAIEKLYREVRKGLIRPLAGVEPYRFHVREVDRYALERTEAFRVKKRPRQEGAAERFNGSGQKDRGHVPSDRETEGKRA